MCSGRWLGVLAVLLGASVPWAPGLGQATIQGTIRDSVTLRPVPGITVALDGRLVATTDAEGGYRLQIAGPGGHVIAFSHPRYSALFKSIDYTIEAGDDTLPTDHSFLWPNLPVVARRLCPRHAVNSGVIVGNVEPMLKDRRDEIRVTVKWGSRDPERGHNADGRQAAFGSITVRVSEEGGFLICNAPDVGEVRLFASIGLAEGPIHTVSMYPRVVAELALRRPGSR